eukprot:157424-Amphidinium_carterae.1
MDKDFGLLSNQDRHTLMSQDKMLPIYSSKCTRIHSSCDERSFVLGAEPSACGVQCRRVHRRVDARIHVNFAAHAGLATATCSNAVCSKAWCTGL